MVPDTAGSSTAQQGSDGTGKAQAPAAVEEWMTSAFRGLEPAAAAKEDGKAANQSQNGDAKPSPLEIDHHSPSKATSAADKDTVAGQMSVIEVDCSVFERILLTMEMGNQHLPDQYLGAIQSL